FSQSGQDDHLSERALSFYGGEQVKGCFNWTAELNHASVERLFIERVHVWQGQGVAKSNFVSIRSKSFGDAVSIFDIGSDDQKGSCSFPAWLYGCAVIHLFFAECPRTKKLPRLLTRVVVCKAQHWFQSSYLRAFLSHSVTSSLGSTSI